jgi:hypothetical protein
MPTHRHPIQLHGPDASGNVVLVPYDVDADNGLIPIFLWKFLDSSLRDKLHASFQVPKNYVGSAALVLVWVATVAAGNVLWSCDHIVAGGSEDLDPAALTRGPLDATAQAVPGTTHLRAETSITLTDGDFAADDEVRLDIARDGAGADTAVGDVLLFSAAFQYADA